MTTTDILLEEKLKKGECAWKIARSNFLARGGEKREFYMAHCDNCDGYDTECKDKLCYDSSDLNRE